MQHYMKFNFWVLLAVATCCITSVQADMALYSPGFPQSNVDEQGAVHEAWGTVRLHLEEPADSRIVDKQYKKEPVPTACIVQAADGIKLRQEMYRSPIWPRGADVIEATVSNDGNGVVQACIKVDLPEGASLGERLAVVGGRPVMALPQNYGAERERRDWGCTGGVVAMPGWAKPAVECDPAFNNISAGMGGVPIAYEFKVPPNAQRSVVLGFCESHWSIPGRRPVEIHVEGAETSSVDPLAQWGQHQPGCIQFNAKDADGNGVLDIVIAPHPKGGDPNPILNVVWIFAPRTKIDKQKILLGQMSEVAEYYVDVGGDNDQMLYKGGSLQYRMELESGAGQSLLFLLESPGARGVPDPADMAWTPETLREAARNVWAAHDPAHWSGAK